MRSVGSSGMFGILVSLCNIGLPTLYLCSVLPVPVVVVVVGFIGVFSTFPTT